MSRVLVILVFALGCGSDSEGDVGDGDGDGDGDAQGFTCEAGSVTFPAVDKTCETPSDCTFLTHVIDCCGNTIVVGVNAGDAAGIEAFNMAEAECSAMFPACGCPAGPSEAEDGNTGTPALISVECAANLCRTFVEGS